MMNDFFIMMKSELMITLIIFLLLFIKIGKGMKNDSLLITVQILLFGISLMYGATGTISFAELPSRLDGSSLQIFAFVFLLTAFAFKLSIVPFHLWTADVYEGSPIAATSFLSVLSKGSVAFIFI